MPIGEGSRTSEDLPLVIMFFLVITHSLVHQNDNPRYLVLMLKSNILELPVWYLNHVGCTTFSLSYNVSFTNRHGFSVTMLVQSIIMKTQFNINEQNTLR